MPVFDALYQYSVAERSTSGQALYDWTVESVRAAVKQKVDKAFPSVAARIGIAALIDAALAGPYGLIALGFSAEVATDLVDVLTKMPEHVGNQICNAFASDAPESISSDAWKSPGIGVSVSPDDVMNYWDAPMDAFGDVRHGPFGRKEEALITRSRIEEVPVGVLRYSAGVARVHGLVTFGGVLLEQTCGLAVAIRRPRQTDSFWWYPHRMRITARS